MHNGDALGHSTPQKNSDIERIANQFRASDIPILVPSETASILIDEASAFFKATSNANYKGTICYLNSSGKETKQPFLLSAEHFRKRLYYDNEAPKTYYDIQKIPKELENIKNELVNLRKSERQDL